jgi:pimeloyl-ACP methyl ester carboxylesterase
MIRCALKRFAFNRGVCGMAFVTTKDGVNIYYKDWGPKEAQPIVFHHGWPLSADDWDNQMLFFLAEGYRVIAIDRRGHGRSDQVSEGHDMDHYAADASAVVESLDLRNAVHVGHSTGGGQVARYVAQYGQPQGRVAKAVLVSAVPPLMVKTEVTPAERPSRFSTASAKRWRLTAPSFTSTSPAVLSTALIGMARTFHRVRSRTGGVRG